MPPTSRITIVRQSAADGITLQEWLSYVSTSNFLHLVPPQAGINPFTKQRVEFKAAAGSAYFDTPAGRCHVSYRSGVLTVLNAGDDAWSVAKDIATALGATVALANEGDSGGTPTALRPTILRQYRIKFEQVPTGEQAIDPNKLGQRSKLGGEPDWCQQDDTPSCPKCGKTMTFVGQLDSIEHQDKDNPHSVRALSKQQRFMFADVGLIYIFMCFPCSHPMALLQSG
jgi:hypothetical protein